MDKLAKVLWDIGSYRLPDRSRESYDIEKTSEFELSRLALLALLHKIEAQEAAQKKEVEASSSS